jgi:hypothetical protein
MSELKSKLRKLRLVQFALIAMIPIFAWLGEIARGGGRSGWTLRHWLFAGLALWVVEGGFRYRRRLLPSSREALGKDVSNPKALKQWELGQVIGLAMAGAVVPWGVVVRVQGGALWQASLFYAAGLFLLLLWTPRMPIADAPN